MLRSSNGGNPWPCTSAGSRESGSAADVEDALVLPWREKAKQIAAIFPHEGVARLVKFGIPRLRGHCANLSSKREKGAGPFGTAPYSINKI
jgi:hypothetical protein